MTALSTPSALQQVRAALRANALPGLLLWCGLALLLLAYATVPAFEQGLARWGEVKAAWGLSFAFVSYVVFAVLVPEGLSVALGRQRWTRKTSRDVLYAALVFGSIGLTVDLLYSVQVQLFGAQSDARTLLKKMLFDQFVYSPVSNFVVVALFAWREGGFTRQTLRHLLSADFLTRQYLPVLIAMWCVWIPGVLVIYFMPTALQFPVASLILVFWILIFKFVRKG
nr:Mpv17/PMP22 family protein [uncultured Rhodoferax sp.]